MVRDPEREGGAQVLTAHQEDLLEVAEARTEVRVVGADPRQAGLPVAVAVAIGRSRRNKFSIKPRLVCGTAGSTTKRRVPHPLRFLQRVG